MNFNNYTIKSQEALQKAQEIATSHEQQQLENEHILKGVFAIDEHVIPFVLTKLNVNTEAIKKLLDTEIERFPKVSGGELMLSKEAAKTLGAASALATKMKDEYVSLEHIFLAIFNNA